MKITKVSTNVNATKELYGEYQNAAKYIKQAIDCLASMDNKSETCIESVANLGVVLLDLQNAKK